MWFPRPAAPSDVVRIGGGSGAADLDLFSLLTDAEAEEWPDRVGVVGARDGSAKSTTRLLESSGWVLKTDLAQAESERATVEHRLSDLAATAARTGFWHPRKQWFLMRVDDAWLPCSACPTLRTLRQLADWDAKVRGWTRMLEMGLETAHRHGVLLDLNPSNFGLEERGGEDRLHYLDDECYPLKGLEDLGQAIVARIPEEPEVGEERWADWGHRLQPVLEPFCDGIPDYMEFIDGVRDHPLVPEYVPRRAALLEGFMQGHHLLDPVERRRRREAEAARSGGAPGSVRTQPRITLVFSDVHANLPALEAVLGAASALRVSDYLFLGDAVGYGPFPAAVIDRISELPDLVAVRGNHDHAVGTGEREDGANRIAVACAEWTHAELDTGRRDWLSTLPTEHRTPPVLAVHGAPQDPMRFYGYVYELTYRDNLDYLEREGTRLCWYGHTHVPFVHRKREKGACEKLPPGPMRLLEEGHVLLVNPGSVGMPRDGDPRASFAVFDWETRIVTFHRVAYPVHVTMKALLESGLPEELVYRFEVGR